MTIEMSLVDSALRNWKENEDRVGTFFSALPEEQLLQAIAPGKNSLIYLWGHLTAINDAMLPLLGFRERLHPELDLMFVSNPDRSVPLILTGEDLKVIWNQIEDILWTELRQLSASEWLQKHNSVSADDFAREPGRNRFAILLARTAHLAYHFGQVKLAQGR
jgi:hypothetical protein